MALTTLGRPASLPQAARSALDRPLLPGLAALGMAALFVLLRLRLAAGGDITAFVRAAAPFSRAGRTPPGLTVFGSNGYDGQFYYRLALDPADLHRTAFGITADSLFRWQRIGYPALAWLLSLGQHAAVPVTLVVVNILALGAIGLAGGALAVDCGRHACWGLLLAGYAGFFMSLGNDLTEPVAAACLLAGVLAVRRGRPVLAGLLLGYAALTRETAIAVPVAMALTRLAAAARPVSWPGRPARPARAGRPARAVRPACPARPRHPARPGRADLAWCLPLLLVTAWQLVLWGSTGHVILLAGAGRNGSAGLPFSAFAAALRMNLGLLWPPTGAAYIWCLEVVTLAAFAAAALTAPRLAGAPSVERSSRPDGGPRPERRPRPGGAPRAAIPGYERVALVLFVLELGLLAPDIWSGHADLRSVDEVYLFAVLALLGSRRRLGALACAAALTAVVAAAHQALYLS
jgi:hypothetical protein